MILKSNIMTRGALAVIAAVFAVSVVAPPAVQAQSAGEQVKCGAINTFASTSTEALRIGTVAMKNTFELNIKLLQTAWDVQDAATEALRDTGEVVFSAKISLIKKLPVLNAVKKQALKDYETGILVSFSKRNLDIDAAHAAYREDLMAVIREHHKVLTDLVATLTADIDKALDVAKEKCKEAGSVTNLAVAVAEAKVKLAAAGVREEARAIGEAVKLHVKRNLAIIDAGKTYVKEATQLVKTVTKAVLGR